MGSGSVLKFKACVRGVRSSVLQGSEGSEFGIFGFVPPLLGRAGR